VSDEGFHLGAEVRSSDGKDVGQLAHVLVGPDYGLRALVIKESGRFSGYLLSPGSLLVNDEFIVPKEAVKSAGHNRIDLGLSAADVRRGRAPPSAVPCLPREAGIHRPGARGLGGCTRVRA